MFKFIYNVNSLMMKVLLFLRKRTQLIRTKTFGLISFCLCLTPLSTIFQLYRGGKF